MTSTERVEEQFRIRCSSNTIWSYTSYYPENLIELCKDTGCTNVELEVRSVKFVETVLEDWKPYNE